MTKSKFNPQKHHRRSIRLPGYDYSRAGAYYVTLVTYRRDCLFGEVVNEEMILNDFGKIADEYWHAIPEHFPFMELGAYVVMPNHAHGIMVIHNGESPSNVGATHASPLRIHNSHPRGASPRSLGAIVGSFKSAVTKRIGRELNATGIWQRNYYEHIIRNEESLCRIRQYVYNNAITWQHDQLHPDNPSKW